MDYRVLDLHCDTLLLDRPLRGGGCQLDFDELPAGCAWCQTMAIFVEDSLRGERARRHFVRYADAFDELTRTGGGFRAARTPEDIDAAFAAGESPLLLSVEGGAALGGELDAIEALRARGVRLLTLTWNGDNELAGGCAGSAGLTALGREAVPLLEQAGIVIDVSHLSDAAFWELSRIAKRPFIASHSNARAVCGHRRNLTDDQIRAVAGAGGIIGLNYYPVFLNDSGVSDDIGDLLRHLEHIMELGGERCVALGSDFDGAEMPHYLSSSAKIGVLRRALTDRYGCALADAVMFDNAYAFLKDYGG